MLGVLPLHSVANHLLVRHLFLILLDPVRSDATTSCLDFAGREIRSELVAQVGRNVLYVLQVFPVLLRQQLDASPHLLLRQRQSQAPAPSFEFKLVSCHFVVFFHVPARCASRAHRHEPQLPLRRHCHSRTLLDCFHCLQAFGEEVAHHLLRSLRGEALEVIVRNVSFSFSFPTATSAATFIHFRRLTQHAFLEVVGPTHGPELGNAFESSHKGVPVRILSIYFRI